MFATQCKCYEITGSSSTSWPRGNVYFLAPSVTETCRLGWGRQWRWRDRDCQDLDTQTAVGRLMPLLRTLPWASVWCSPEKLRRENKTHWCKTTVTLTHRRCPELPEEPQGYQSSHHQFAEQTLLAQLHLLLIASIKWYEIKKLTALTNIKTHV